MFIIVECALALVHNFDYQIFAKMATFHSFSIRFVSISPPSSPPSNVNRIELLRRDTEKGRRGAHWSGRVHRLWVLLKVGIS